MDTPSEQAGPARVEDPYRHLLLHHHDDAVRAGMQSDIAAYIRYAIAEYMADLETNDDLEDLFTLGCRFGLRVAYLAAGGQVDGTEEQWAQVVEAGRG